MTSIETSTFAPYSATSFNSGRGTSSASIVTFATLSAALVAGTGGCYATSNMAMYAENNIRPIVLVIGQTDRKSTAIKLSTAQLVMSVREAFGLNLSQIASIFGVTRQTVYGWLQGAEPRASILSRIWELEALSPRMRALPVVRRGSLLTRSLSGGSSLMRLLEENGDVPTGITVLERQLAQSAFASGRAKRVGQSIRRSADQISRVVY